MIVNRAEIAAILAAHKQVRTGTVQPGADTVTKLFTFGQRTLPVLVQAEAVFWEAQGAPLTPRMAALGLALHQAEPGQFRFDGCSCSGQYLALTQCHDKPGPPCARRRWLDQLRERVTMPPNIETPQIIKPVRA